MKIFKPLYYSVLAVLALVFAVLASLQSSGAFVTAGDSADNIQRMASDLSKYSRSTLYDTADHNNTVDYITRTLSSFGLDSVSSRVLSDDEGKVDTVVAKPDNPSFVRMKTSLSAEEVSEAYSLSGKTSKYYGTDVVLTNIVAYFPGTSAEGGVTLFTAHYDSLKSGKGIINNLGSVAAMLEAVRNLKIDGYEGANSLMFVFTDGAEAGALGAYALSTKFVGFDNAYASVNAAINFDSTGTKGPLVLYSASDNGSELAAKIVGGTKGAYAYAGSEIVAARDGKVFDSDVYGEGIPYLNFSVIGSRESYNTALDNVDNFNAKAYTQAYDIIMQASKTLGGASADSLKGGKVAAFGFLGLNVVYGPVANYILLGVTIALMVGVVVANALKQKFCFGRMLIGAGVQLLSLLAALVAVFALYYIIAGLLSLMGFINTHVLGMLAASSVPLVIGAAIASVSISALVQHLLKRVFTVKAGDVVRGNVLIFFVLSVVFAFVAPSLASLLMLVTILELIAVLAWVLAKDKFRSAFGMDIDRLILFAVPVILVLPIFAGVLLPVAEVMGAVWYPVIMLMAASLLGFVTPYFNHLTPALDGVAKKLPERTLRIERTVTEEVEHHAKKGKFETKTYRKLIKKKVARKYSAVFGLSVLLIIGIIVSIITSMSSVAYGYNYRLGVGGNEPAVYYVKDSAGIYGTAPAEDGYVLLIKDSMVYKYFKYELDGYVYNQELKGYTKSVSTGNIFGLKVATGTSEGNKKTFTVIPDQADWGLFYDITIPNASSVKSIKIESTDNDNKKATKEITFDGKSKEIILSNLSGVSKVTIEGMSSAYAGKITVEATANENNIAVNMSTFTELSEIKEYADSKGFKISAGVLVTASADI